MPRRGPRQGWKEGAISEVGPCDLTWRVRLIEQRGERLFLGKVHLFRLRGHVCFESTPKAQRFMKRSIGIDKR